MAKLHQNELERLQEMVREGMSVDEANVEIVRKMRVRLITSKVPLAVRKALNAAVKRGYLGHAKKDGHKPEAYYHPTFEYLVAGERNRHAEQVVRALAGVMA